MRHVRMLGLCLVAVLAIAAVVTSSASALPEWGKCEKTGPGGKYSDANCTVKAKKGAGEYTWKKGKELAPVKFKGHSIGGGGVLTTEFRECNPKQERITKKQCAEKGEKVEVEGELAVECEAENNTGEATGTNDVANVKVSFTGCKLLGAIPCKNFGGTEEEVTTNTLKGSLGYISKPAKEVGLLLEPAVKKGTFAEFECGEIFAIIVGVGNKKEGAAYEPESHGGYDGVISPVTPVNVQTSEYEQVYTHNFATQENIPSKFEGKHIELLENYTYAVEEPTDSTMWSKSAEEITNISEPTEPGEIKA